MPKKSHLLPAIPAVHSMMGMEPHAKRLARQVEEIADNSPDRTCEVIVQMAPSDDLKRYLEISSEIMRRRRSIVSARELVPPRREEKLPRGGSKSIPQTSAAPIERYFRAEYEIQQTGKAVEREGLSALSPLLKSSWSKQVVASRAPSSSKGKKRNQTANSTAPNYFWSARAAVFEVTKDELHNLPGQLPMVAGIYPNRQVRIPPVTKGNEERPAIADYKGYTWGLSRTGALASWGGFDTKGKNVLVAVLDTGVDPDHPDLQDKIKDFAEFDTKGRLILSGAKKAYDSDQHGTHCAGIIAGGKESGRHIGMAPEAKILGGLVLKKGSGTDAQILAGMEWAMTKGAHVISMSLGGLRMESDVLDTYTLAMMNANRMGIPVVVAVGNEGSQTTGSPGNDYFAFTVGATDVSERAAGFSGGRTQIIEQSRYIDPQYLPVVYSKPDVTAPGVDIYSSIPKKGYEAWNGTSMATPHVAGALALLLSGSQTILGLPGTKRVDILQNLLISSVSELGESGQNHRFGYGRIDVLRALGYAQELGYIP